MGKAMVDKLLRDNIILPEEVELIEYGLENLGSSLLGIKHIKKLLIYAIVIGLLTNCAIITNAKSNKSLLSDNCTVAETCYDTEINVTGQTPYNISELQVSKKQSPFKTLVNQSLLM
ncbi:MAG: hypothetical protein ACI4EX_12365 [Lachnospiraceae bacterium]